MLFGHIVTWCPVGLRNVLTIHCVYIFRPLARSELKDVLQMGRRKGVGLVLIGC
jgi:hypothetical protein